MDFSVTSNFKSFANAIQQQANKVEPAAERALDRVSEAVKQQTFNTLSQEIYSKPIPTRYQVAKYNVDYKNVTRRNVGRQTRGVTGKGNEPAWKRSGDLQKGEVIVVAGKLHRTIKSEGNADKYAERRHELGVTWKPQRPALGIVRKAEWRKDGMAKAKPQVQPVFEQTFINELRN